MIRAFTVAALLSVTTLSPHSAAADQTTASGTAPVLEHTSVPTSPGATADAMEPPRHDHNATCELNPLMRGVVDDTATLIALTVSRT